MIYAGSHISASKGYEAMGKQALKLGADTFAFFTRNPRGGNAKKLDLKDVERLRVLLEEHHFGRLVAHAPYTLNPCGAKEEVRDFAFRSGWRLCRAITTIFTRAAMWGREANGESS